MKVFKTHNFYSLKFSINDVQQFGKRFEADKFIELKHFEWEILKLEKDPKILIERTSFKNDISEIQRYFVKYK